MAERRDERPESPAKRRLEAAASLLGAVLALGTLGVIVWDGVQGKDSPPIVRVEAGDVHPHDNGFVLEIAAVNEGGSTAAEVLVEGELRRGAETVATSEATFDYLPARSRREGGLFFAEDPRGFEVVLSAKGYRDP